MDSALQVDLARSEAPVQQILNSPLGEVGSHLAVSQQSQPPSDIPKRSSKGGSNSFTQIRLKPKKSSRDPSPSLCIQDGSDNTLELGEFDETANIVTLQPLDKGFGAWSYVAGAFAMYIVVWGKFAKKSYSGQNFLLTKNGRFSTRFPNISNLSVNRNRRKAS